MENKEVKEVKKKRFLQLYVDEIPAGAVDKSSHFVHQFHLGYDAKGRVIVIDDGDFDMFQLIQADKESSTLMAQIKQMAINGQTSAAAPAVFNDVSDLPDNVNDMTENVLRTKAEAKKAAENVGLDFDAATKLSVEDLNNLISEKVAAMFAKKTEVKENE